MGKQDLPKLPVGETVKGKWEVEEVLGAGAFGAVYRVKALKSGDGVKEGDVFAMKTESTMERVHILKVEQVVLKELMKIESRHTCRIVDRGRNDEDTWVFVVMTLVGPSLQSLRKAARGRFTSSTALRLSAQCLEGIRDLHSIGYLHRDVKPANFAIGRRETREHRTVFILDFGLCRSFLNEAGELRCPRDSAGFRGTVRYASLATHKGQDTSRKDDLESWFYLLIEFYVGRLPWTFTTGKEEVREVKEKSRKNGSIFRGVPTCLKALLDYSDALAYWDIPDHQYYLDVLGVAMKEVKNSSRRSRTETESTVSGKSH